MKALVLAPRDAAIFLDRVVQLVMECSPLCEADENKTAEEMAAYIREERNLVVVVKSSEGRIVGFCGVTPHDLAVHELSMHDPLLKRDPGRYYFDMVGIEGSYRKSSAFLHLALVTVESVLERGVNKFSTHSLMKNRMNETMKKLFPDHKGGRVIANWLGGGDACEYLEFIVHDRDLLRMRRLLRM